MHGESWSAERAIVAFGITDKVDEGVCQVHSLTTLQRRAPYLQIGKLRLV